MARFHDKTFPGENEDYRHARDELLAAEIELRSQVERVAALRRGLPSGGAVSEDYVFQNTDGDIKLSELFEAGKSTLVVYSFMYAPDAENPCPMCTSMLDSLNGAAGHIEDQVNLAIVARAPIEKTMAWAQSRGWDSLRFVSSQNNSFNVDYFAEDDAGSQWPCLNVFTKAGEGTVSHFYATELFFADSPDGMHARHVDMIWPLWNVLDMTPQGRGTDWYPQVKYQV